MTGIFGKLVTVISLPIQFIWMDHQREIVAVGKKQFTLCIHMRVLSENDMFTKNLMVHHYIPIFVQAKNWSISPTWINTYYLPTPAGSKGERARDDWQNTVFPSWLLKLTSFFRPCGASVHFVAWMVHEHKNMAGHVTLPQNHWLPLYISLWYIN